MRGKTLQSYFEESCLIIVAQTQKKAHLVVKFAFQMILHKKVGNKNEADIWFPLGSCKQAYGEKMWC